jgi:hypothetical protein
MTTQRMVKPVLALALLTGSLVAAPAWAQRFPITPEQRQTATQVAQAGVPLRELSPNAPQRYTIRSGDTLWGIASLFLKSPWRWPELWGMNLQEIQNPHLIYPGQVLELEQSDGMARLRLAGSRPDTGDSAQATGTDESDPPTVRLSPRVRSETLATSALQALQGRFIEAFLAEPLVVDEATLQTAPRIVSAQEERVLLTRGDRAYARGPVAAPLLDDQRLQKQYRVFRNATALKDPISGEVLGFEAQYVGRATLVRGESTAEVQSPGGAASMAVVPATIDIVAAKEEMRVGDRLLPEPESTRQSYVPHAPPGMVDGRIVSVYGSAVVNAAQNQVVAINRGVRDGMEPGLVLAILKDGVRMVDKTDPERPLMKLPDERNGLLMVFRSFERVSYALILEITDGVRVGDRLTQPR